MWFGPAQQYTTAAGVITTAKLPYRPDLPPLVVNKGTAWHCSSFSVLQSILQNQEVWSTRWDVTNDSSEARHGLQFLENSWKDLYVAGEVHEETDQILRSLGLIKDYMERYDEVTLFCASRTRDDLTQWRLYGRGPASVSIGLDMGVELVPQVDHLPITAKRSSQTGWPWLKVVYTERQKLLLARRFVRELNYSSKYEGLDPADFLMLSVLTVLNMKHQQFSAEKEVRCVSISSGIRLRTTGKAGQTYVAWRGVPTLKGDGASNRLPLPITEIVLPPQATIDHFVAVSAALNEAGLDYVPVSWSSNPYRW